MFCASNLCKYISRGGHPVRLHSRTVVNGSNKQAVSIGLRSMENNLTKKPAGPQARKHFPQNVRKKRAPAKEGRPSETQIYITTKSNYKAQQKQCEDLLNSGVKDIYLHCLGNAINRGINLALNLVNASNNALSYAINTSTIQLIDELHPLCDDDEIALQHRNNSAIHIRISRNTPFDIDIA